MLVIIGLGNPGRRYRGTRHNVGREVVESLAARIGVRLEDDGWARTGRARVDGVIAVLAVPETYMNVSGQAVRDILRRRRRRPSDLLVVHDDLDLPLGQLRLRPGNGAGGHNGIRSIIEELGTSLFPRLRIGIGRPPAGVDPAEFVLDRFTTEERRVINAVLSRAVDATLAVATEGLQAAMNRYNMRAGGSLMTAGETTEAERDGRG
jgi:PTH1 family peptidyl-tRNA hydrolase